MLDKSICHLIPCEGKFYFRFNNGGFGSKWMGLWDCSDKLLDYWAFKCGDVWLSPGNFSGFSGNLSDNRANFSHFGGDFSEYSHIERKEGRLFFRALATSKRQKAPWEIELGINLRGASDNRTDCPGKFASLEGGVLRVESPSNERKIEISGLSGFSISESFEKTHSPGEVSERLGWKYFNESPQNCLVIRLKGAFPERECGFSISLGQSLLPGTGNPPKIQYFGMGNVGELGNSAISAARGFSSDRGYFAGFPYFTEFWTRDACISIPALSRAGEYSLAEDFLKKIGESQRNDGCIPNFVGKTDYSGADTTPLFILASIDFWKWSGGREIDLGRISKACEFFGKTDVDSDGFSETDRGSCFDPLLHWTTWMDSIERSGRAIEIQFLWGEALRQGGILLRDNSLESKGRALIERAFEKFRDPEKGIFLDTLGGFSENIRSSNILFGLAFSEIPEKERDACLDALDTLESEEFSTSWGIRTASRRNGNFNGSGYHTGAVWNLTTALMSLSEFRLGRDRKGKEYLKILSGNLGKRCFASLDELYDGEGNPQGAVAQSWSSSIVPRIFDDCVFGITPDPERGEISFSPRNGEFGEIERVGKIAGRSCHLKISSDGGVLVDGRKLPERRIEI